MILDNIYFFLTTGSQHLSDIFYEILGIFVDGESMFFGDGLKNLFARVRNDVAGRYFENAHHPHGLVLVYGIYPAVSIAEGSTCDMIFNQDKFLFPPKSSKFSQIVCATSII
jgi:hypothetical protein